MHDPYRWRVIRLMSVRACILLFDEVDLLDVGGPYEVFLTANRLTERSGQLAPFDVITAATTPRAVASYGGLGLIPHTTIDRAGAVDVVVVPGAIDIDAVIASSPAFIGALRDLAASAQLTASVCTGAFILGEAGLLDERHWTTHWEDVAVLAERIESSSGRDDVPWVDDGRIITSGGLSSGIAMALHVVDRLVGRDLASATARQLDYAWDPGAGT